MSTKRQGSTKTKDRISVREPDMYDVMLLNDDFTPMDFVVQVLVQIFYMDVIRANAVMLDVHHHGEGVAGTYAFDIARSKVEKCIDLARKEGYPLRLKLKPHI